ncbi:hypothetical protein ACHAPT_007254 [Fusarium lateritium]
MARQTNSESSDSEQPIDTEAITDIHHPRTIDGPSFRDKELTSVDLTPLRLPTTDENLASGERSYSHDLLWDDSRVPRTPAPPASESGLSELNELNFCAIELISDRENAPFLEWEQSRLNSQNRHDTSGMKRAAGAESHSSQNEQPADHASSALTQSTPSARFSKDSEMKHVGLSDAGSPTDLACTEQWIDSGYASLSEDTAPTSAGNSTSKQQPANRGSSQLGNDDEDDASTVYSAADSVPEDELETYKSELSEAILKAVLPHVSDAELLESLASLLPALLQSFALRLGCPGSSKAEREIMYFVHKHRNDIAGRFNNAIKYTADGEGLTPLAAKQNEAPVTRNVAQWLQEVSHGEVTEQDMPHTHDSIPDEIPCRNSAEGEPKSAVEVEEQPSLPDMPDMDMPDKRGYRDAVFNSVAYRWLTAALVKMLTMSLVSEEDVCANLRQEIHDSLSRRRTVSSRLPSKRHAMNFTVEWDPKLFLREQFPQQSHTGRLFGQTLTLTGSLTDAQALPCAEYLLQIWPTTGPIVLEVLKTALVSGTAVAGELADKSLITCFFDHSQLHVKAKGTADSIATVAEQIAWLGASLRQSCSESRLATCRPQIRTSRRTGTERASCHIDFSVQTHDTSSQGSSVGQCWHEMFQNPVVVEGYPIPRRAEYGSGLEIPLSVMSGLTDCPRINQYMGHHFLKGFSTALVPTGKMKDAVLWHLYYTEDGSRLPYPDTNSMDKASVGFGELSQSRHIVGWCSKAKFFSGAAAMNYDIKPSQLQRAGREFALEKVSFSVGQILTAGCQFAIGRKDRHVRITRGSYKAKLAWLDQKYVTLWDVDEERGWLVNGNSALLHLLRASLEFSKTDKFNSEFLFQEDQFMESPDPFTLDSVLHVLLDPTNQKLKLYLKEDYSYRETKDLRIGRAETVTKTVTSWTTVKDRIEELYETLEKLIDHNATSEDSYKGVNAKPRLHDQLQGWDFADIARDRDPFHLRIAKLPLDSTNWVELTRAIPAITLFGRGFGDIIRASPPEPSGCRGWEDVPTNRHLLCVSVADLRAIIDQIGDNETNPITVAPGILWKNPFSDNPFHTDCQCAARCPATKEGKHHCIQELMSSMTFKVQTASTKLGFAASKGAVDLYLAQHDNGAVIFGRRPELKLSRGTSAITESPSNPKPSLEATLGHSSTSGGSNMADLLSPSSSATLEGSGMRGGNSPTTLSASSPVLETISTVDEQGSGSQAPGSHQAIEVQPNNPPGQVTGGLSPDSPKPKGLSWMRNFKESIEKKWREHKSKNP